MGIKVKEWHPAEGCKTCKDAARIMREQTSMGMRTSSLAMQKIREQAATIQTLTQERDAAHNAALEEAVVLARSGCFEIGCTIDEATGVVRRTRDCIASGIEALKTPTLDK